jgi:hypothetical protein
VGLHSIELLTAAGPATLDGSRLSAFSVANP